jgi:hypothetical protein
MHEHAAGDQRRVILAGIAGEMRALKTFAKILAW